MARLNDQEIVLEEGTGNHRANPTRIATVPASIQVHPVVGINVVGVWAGFIASNCLM